MRVDQFAFVPARGGVLAHAGALPSLEEDWEVRSLQALLPPTHFLRTAAHVELEPGHAVRLRVFEPVDEPGTPADRVAIPDALRDAFDRCVAELEGRLAIPEQRPAWSRPGFHAEAEAWAGMPLELVRVWPLSAVLRNGDVYFKAVFSIFRHEPAITAALDDVAPRVLRSDDARGWMLLEAAHGDEPDPLDAIRRMAAVHETWSSRIDEALALGAHDRRDASGPWSLVHGDFHPGNVIGSTILDWSDAAVANPLIDVNYFAFTVGDDRRAELLDAYGAPDAYEAETYEYIAQSYVGIAAACAPDDRWWFEGEPERWLRRASDVRAGRRPSRDT